MFFIKHESKTLTRTELARRRLAEAVSAQYMMLCNIAVVSTM